MRSEELHIHKMKTKWLLLIHCLGCVLLPVSCESSGSEQNFSPTIVSVYPELNQMNYTVNENVTVTFECSATGIPPPTITWLKDGTELNMTTNQRVTVNDAVVMDGDGKSVVIVMRTLDLTNTMDSDSGTYFCKASSNATTSPMMMEFELIVQVAPMILSLDPLQLNVTEFRSATFTCNATGRPRPSITWYRGDGINRTVLVNDEGYVNTTHEDLGEREVISTLKISAAAISGDTVYTCVASNEVGEVEMDAFLNAQVKPVITSVHPDVNQTLYTVNETNTVTFECSATGIPPPTITWLRDGTELNMDNDACVMINDSDDSEMFIELNGEMVPVITRTLRITSIMDDDSDIYTCVAMNTVQRGTVMEDFELIVQVAPMIFSLDPIHQDVTEPNSATFTCNATGRPTPSIRWYRDDETLLMDSVFNVNITNKVIGERVVASTLTIFPTVPSDDMNYTCVAENVVGRYKRIADLDVYVFPMIMISVVNPPSDREVIQMNYTVNEGDTVTFECSATGIPPPTITWLRNVDMAIQNNTVMDFTEMNTIDRGDGEMVSMVTRSLTLTVMDDDSGTYTCVATNEADPSDLVMQEFELIVQISPMIESVYPELNQMNYTVNENDTVTFECSATGIPPPTITWLRDGTELNMTTDQRVTVNDAVVMDDDGEIVAIVMRTLDLTNTMDSDSGTYFCKATSNATTSPMMMEFELIVQVAPIILSLDPLQLNVTEFRSAMFTCNATGRPRPSITWYRGDDIDRKMLVNDEGYVITTHEDLGEREVISTLKIFAAAISGDAVYTCVASNEVGEEEMDAFLNAQVKPVITSVHPDVNQTLYTVNETNKVTFECSATGIPPPTITWLRDGTELNMNNDTRVMTNDSEMLIEIDGEMVPVVTRTLRITSIMDDDSGNYTCVAMNTVQKGTVMEDFELIVQVAPMIFSLDPIHQDVTEPNSATFTCNATGRPTPSIRWYRDDGLLLVDGVFNVNITNKVIGERVVASTLTIFPTVPSDDMNYTCVAENVVGRYKGITDLDVYVSPMIMISVVNPPFDREVIQMNYTVNEGDTVTFECSATGIPPPTITWLRNVDMVIQNNTVMDFTEMNTIDRGDGEMVSMVTRSLTLTVMDDDSGTHTCVATNEADPDMVMEEFELIVQIAPDITYLEPPQQTVTQPTSATIICEAIGRPRPTIRWYRVELGSNNRTLLQESDSNITNTTTLSSTLTISPTAPSDATGYLCVAENVVNTTEATVSLTVRVVPEIVFSAPEGGYFVIENDTVTFTCNATGIPAPDIQWFKDGYQVNETIEGPRSQNGNINSNVMFGNPINKDIPGEVSNASRTLTIMNTTDEDKGMYSCQATNNVESGMDSQEFELIVHTTPVITSTSSPGEVNLSHPAVVLCLVTGYPLPSITWQKDGQAVDITLARIDTFNFTSTRPELKDDFDSSSYTGKESLIEFLHDNVDGFSVNETLALGELGVVGVLSFEEVVRNDTANYTCSAANELPETTRLVTVSDPLPLTILERPDPPANVTAFEFAARWIALRWTPTFNGNKRISSFVIYFNETEEHTQRPLTELDNDGGSEFIYNITNTSVIVFPFTKYSFTVVSCNEIGCSNQSEPSGIIMTLQDTASQPLNLTVAGSTTTNVTLTWRTPAMANGNITHYTFTYTGTKPYNSNFSVNNTLPKAVEELLLISEPGGDMLQTTLMNLTPGTTYTITVAAVNGAGVGEFSEPVTAVTNVESSPSPSSDFDSGVIIGAGVIAALSLILLLINFVLCCVICINLKKKQGSYKLEQGLMNRSDLFIEHSFSYGVGEPDETAEPENEYTELLTIITSADKKEEHDTKQCDETTLDKGHKMFVNFELPDNSDYQTPMFIAAAKSSGASSDAPTGKATTKAEEGKNIELHGIKDNFPQLNQLEEKQGDPENTKKGQGHHDDTTQCP